MTSQGDPLEIHKSQIMKIAALTYIRLRFVVCPGAHFTLVYSKSKNTKPHRSRRRKIIWFNPPYCQSIETNVARKFLLLVDKHFPPGHHHRKIFNRNTLKVSYSWMSNIDSTIKNHNSGLINSRVAGKTCNCRKNDTCSVDGRCLEEGIVYEATIKSRQEIKKYVGLTEGTFKKRLYGHRQSFKNSSLKNATEQSKHIEWEKSGILLVLGHHW